MAVAAPAGWVGLEDPRSWSHLRVATKYPEITRRHFAARGVQAECIKLNGAIELAPLLGLCRHIVDLVQTGATLKANGLVEIEHIADISSRLIVNRPALKTRPEELGHWIERFRAVTDDAGPLRSRAAVGSAAER
jgi:ATP phosphoribosyltransferase